MRSIQLVSGVAGVDSAGQICRLEYSTKSVRLRSAQAMVMLIWDTDKIEDDVSF